MPEPRKAATILFGPHRTRKKALEAMAQLGTPDAYTLTATYIPGVEIDGTWIEAPGTRYTAMVVPHEKEITSGRQ